MILNGEKIHKVFVLKSEEEYIRCDIFGKEDLTPDITLATIFTTEGEAAQTRVYLQWLCANITVEECLCRIIPAV